MSEIMKQIWTPQMQVIATILVIGLIVIYALSILWVVRDARMRGTDSKVWGIVAIVPIVGLIAYLLMRPSMLLIDKDEQELEVALKQRQLMKYGECANCGYPVREDYIVCPSCQTRLRNVCSNCRRPLDPQWSVCPFCAQQVHSASTAQNTTSSSRRTHVATTTTEKN